MVSTGEETTGEPGAEVDAGLCRACLEMLEARGAVDDALMEAEIPGLRAALGRGDPCVGWASFRLVLGLVGKHFSREEIEALGEQLLGTSQAHELALMLMMLGDPYDCCLWLCERPRHRAVSCIVQSCERVDMRRLRVRARMGEGYEGSPEYFIARAGFLRAVARRLGGKGAGVQYSLSEEGASYEISVPLRARALGQLGRWWRGPGQTRALAAAFERILERREALEHRLEDFARATQRHRVREQIFDTVFRSAPIAALISDTREGRIKDANRVFEDLSGYGIDEARGQRATDLGLWVSRRERDQVRGVRDGQGHALRAHEVRLRNRRGEDRVMLLSTDRIFLDGEECQLWYATDITERKRAESELARYRNHLEELVAERSRELEASRAALVQSEKLAAIGTLAAGVAHEINNPVGLIQLAAEFALEDTNDAEADAVGIQREALQTCVREARRCDAIVRNILRFASAGSDEREPEDLCAIVGEVARMARAYSRGDSTTLELSMPQEPVPVECNRLELEQALLNLVRNAEDSARDGVRIGLRCHLADDRACVDVSDDGPGIDPRHLPHVFDPFYSTRKESGGSGLGLSVTHGIVAAHGGRIRVESVLGKGTTMSIDLPLHREGLSPGA